MPQQAWVKKIVKAKEWKDKYEEDQGYWMLSKTIDGSVWIGFLTVLTENVLSKIKSHDLEWQTEEDLRRSDAYRRANNFRPFPLESDEERQRRIKTER